MNASSKIKIKLSDYHNSFTKKVFDNVISSLGIIVSIPVVVIIVVFIKITSEGPVFFRQKRVGKNGKVFTLIKFRTMIEGAEKLQNKYRHLNVSDRPTFKIPNDPRYTRFGRLLVKTGLDELPQLINVLSGEMSLVGPRPLPTYEEKQLTETQRLRELVQPGITSNWVIKGAHRLKFNQWMELDKKYVEKANLFTDVSILGQTAILIVRLTLRKLFLLLNTK